MLNIRQSRASRVLDQYLPKFHVMAASLRQKNLQYSAHLCTFQDTDRRYFFMDKLAIAILKALHDGVVTKGEAVEYCRMYGIML